MNSTSWPSDDLVHANAPAGDERVRAAAFEEEPAVASSTEVTVAADEVDERWLEPDLAVAAMLRDVAGPPEQTDADVSRMFTRAIAWRECPVSRERMIEINQLSLAYFRRHLPVVVGAALSGRPIRRGHHQRPPIPARSSTRRLDQPRQPPPTTGCQRR